MPLASIKQSLATITHGTFWHCRMCFYTFVGQPSLKQLYVKCHSWSLLKEIARVNMALLSYIVYIICA